ncbi:MAG: PAS domain-containing protein [Terriglobales bacterium]|jgi:PAS domain S-box-containing protein
MEASESPQFTISPTARRYALAGLAAVGALLLRKMLSPWFGTTNVYHTVGAAVLFSAWYCGVGPAIVATLISVVGSWYFILLPLHSFRFEDHRNQIAGLVEFGILSGFVIALGEVNRRSQAALSLSEERLRLAAESSNTGLWEWEPAGAAYFSPAWKRLLGYADHEIPNRFEEWSSRVHPGDLPRLMAEVDAYLKLPPQRWESEFRIRHRDGSYRWFLARAAPECDEQGRVKRVLGAHIDITDSKQTEERLRLSEERYRSLAEATSDIVWAGTMVDDEIEVPVWLELTGQTPEEAREKWAEAVHPDERGRVIEAWSRFLKEGDRYEQEFRLRGPDGQYRWFSSRAVPVREKDGSMRERIGTFTDITERKQVEAALRNNEELLSLFIEHAPAALAMFDREMRYIRVSRRWRTNYVPGDRSLIGELHDDVHPVIPEIWKDAHRRGLRGEVVQGDGSLERADGSIRWVRWEIRPWRNRAGEIGGIVIFSEDITDRKGAEAALSDSEARLRTALEAASMGTFERDLRTGEAHWMPTTEVMFGLEPGTGPVSIEDFVALIYPEDRDHFSRLMAESTEAGVAGGEWRVIWPDGSIHWIYGRWMVFKDDQGQPTRIIGVDYDITARKQAEESLRIKSDQLRALTIRVQQVREEERTMVARDLHDQIGQILTAVKMDVDWVARCLSPQDDAQLSDRLAATLNRLKDATQSLRSICTRLRPGVLDDLGLAAAIEWQVKEFASITGIHCDVSVPQEDFPLDADRSTAIFRILQEALTNVTRHAEAKMVRASLAQQDGNVLLVVQDDGKGIRESDIESSSRTSLGLLGMKERAEACGGELQIWGDPGTGTTVALQIPLAESRHQGGNDADPAGR